MKKIILAALLLFPVASFAAQSDHLVKWDIGTGLSISNFNAMEFDVNVYRRYISLNGAIIDNEGGMLSATGSCFPTTKQQEFTGISCEFTSANRRFELDTDANLTGTLKEKDSNGNVLGSALATIDNIQ